MTTRVLYLCPNDYMLEEPVEIFAPLYVDMEFPTELQIHDIYSVGDLVTSFVGFGERSYYSLSEDICEQHLLKVMKVDTNSEGEELQIKFYFENGMTYTPEREYVVGDCYSRSEIELLKKMVEISALHLYYLECDLTPSSLVFETERWG